MRGEFEEARPLQEKLRGARGRSSAELPGWPEAALLTMTMDLDPGSSRAMVDDG